MATHRSPSVRTTTKRHRTGSRNQLAEEEEEEEESPPNPFIHSIRARSRSLGKKGPNGSCRHSRLVRSIRSGSGGRSADRSASHDGHVPRGAPSPPPPGAASTPACARKVRLDRRRLVVVLKSQKPAAPYTNRQETTRPLRSRVEPSVRSVRQRRQLLVRRNTVGGGQGGFFLYDDRDNDDDDDVELREFCDRPSRSRLPQMTRVMMAIEPRLWGSCWSSPCCCTVGCGGGARRGTRPPHHTRCCGTILCDSRRDQLRDVSLGRWTVPDE
jgi:hypothetical protein